jgi:competence protein ComFC
MSIMKSLLDLFYPPCCPFCGSLLGAQRQKSLSPQKNGSGNEQFPEGNLQELGAIICRNCLSALPWLENCCELCARPRLQSSRSCPFCSGQDFAFNGCCAVGRYEGGLRDILHRFKYRGQRSLAAPLGKLMAVKIKKMSWSASLEMVAPVPLSPEKYLLRGYNQAALLAEVVSRELGLPMQELLKRSKNTESQTGLNRQQRRANISGSFVCNDIQQKGIVLLLDDVFTSGSTAHEASLVLKKAGFRQVYVAVLAR